jgi:hypothetical protein
LIHGWSYTTNAARTTFVNGELLLITLELLREFNYPYFEVFLASFSAYEGLPGFGEFLGLKNT